MENNNSYNSLYYGNIVKILSDDTFFENKIFFIDYVDNKKLILLSEDLNKYSFFLNEDNTFDNINEIIVIHENENGYAITNKLLPGTFIKIYFSNSKLDNNMSHIQGEIVNLEKDMITVKLDSDVLIYIDFEYGGLLDKYNIYKIEIINNLQKYHADNFEKISINNNELEPIDDEDLVYSLEQQINDYIEKVQIVIKNKKQVLKEIDKYCILLEEYTDLKNNKKKIKLPNNQLLHSIFYIDNKISYPVTCNIHKNIYYEMNDAHFDFQPDTGEQYKQWNYSVIANDIFNSISENMYDTPNITFINSKIKKHHKMIKLPFETNAVVINKDHKKNLVSFYSIQKGIPTLIDYDLIHVDSNKSMIISGIAFPSLNIIKSQSKYQYSKSILEKCTIEDDLLYDEGREFMTFMTKNRLKNQKLFHPSKLTYYPKSKNHTSYKEYITSLNCNLNNIYYKLFDNNETNIYQFLTKLSLFNISNLNSNDYYFIDKHMKENINYIKRSFYNINRKLKKKKRVELLKIEPNEPFYQYIIDNYNVNESKHYQMSELLEHSLIDNMNILFHDIQLHNDNLNINLDEEEIQDYINQITLEVNGDFDIEQAKKIKYSKLYNTKNDLLKDGNKIILRNVDKETSKFFDPIQTLLTKVKTFTNYTGDVSNFVTNLNILLESLYNNELMEEMKSVAFSDSDDQTKIINLLITEISVLKIKNLDKCYVKDEKIFYIYDKGVWTNIDEYGNTLSKKKLIKVKNSIDDLDEIKTKIINDFVIDLIHKTNQDADIAKIQLIDRTTELKKKKLLISNCKYRDTVKYNSQKIKYSKYFSENSDYYETMIESPFSSLLYDILSIDDLERRFTLIKQFVSLMTIDNGDENWLYCVNTNTKLLPKFLYKLSDSYLIYNNYEEIINNICQNEGYLSEDGDAWIHKESGFIIQYIEFDTNYGYDENGFKIKLDTIPDQDIIVQTEEEDEDELEDDLRVPDEDKNKEGIKSKHYLQTLQIMKSLTYELMKLLGIAFNQNTKHNVIFDVLYKIYLKSLKKEKYKANKSYTMIYNISSFLFIYIQCNNILIKKTFPNCNEIVYDGYPLENNKTSVNGINSLACLLYNIFKNNDNIGPFISLKEIKKEKFKQNHIKVDLINYIKNFMLKHDYINDMILNKRIKMNKALKGEAVIFPPLQRFKPSLLNIETNDNEEMYVYENTEDIYSKYNKINIRKDIINMKIEEIINNDIKDKSILLHSNSKIPYLVNFCCKNEEFMLDIIKNKGEFKEKLQLSNDLQEIITDLKQKYYTNTVIHIKKNKAYLLPEYNENRIYEKEIIYYFAIKVLNFENNKNIPDIFDELSIANLSSTEKQELKSLHSIHDKIEYLEQKDYNFDNSLMHNLINIISFNQYTKYVDKTNKSEPENIISDIYNDFKKQFMILNADLGENKVAGLKDGNFLLGNEQANANDNIAAVSSSLDKINARTDSNVFIDKFVTETLALKESYIAFLNNFIKGNTETTMLNIINKWEKINNSEEEIDLYNKQLYNINYSLITIIPKLLNRSCNHEDIIYKQWQFAKKHETTILDNYINMFSIVSAIDDEEYLNHISNIHEYKEILVTTFFNVTNKSQKYFLLYLFYKLMNIYIDFNKDNSTLIKSNKEIINYIKKYSKVTSFTYENVKTKYMQTRNAEKKEKTDQLKNMKANEREAEKYKMSAKLGEWSYGNHKRVFKYYKEFYEQDKEKSNKVKEIVDELYNDKVTNEDFNSYHSEINEEEGDINYNISNVPDEDGNIIDEEGNEIDIENY
uniref:Uncharacterized protein n=1 Tax=Florenciella sp. virus SA2 TaxID=3240092 RepID=A0AB39JBQ9_9VIRU